ncbi:MAG TPA: AAA family ATPase [Candidatus Hydrogenedentes bacterium]|nr:AAA family ATPase [Candidatus Hydrogenedentota bacterium]HOH51478.1 AAA family ATPase [Candidatus Hydrogenedentota bacterium]HQL96076.1 AAA family ATPase [Candidatus Hydrogenedentota bacterium]HRZ82143.1 AAA family ATPase [Candidatus Hydrogenedentota bacterium]
MMQPFMFPEKSLGDDLVSALRRLNPWWEGRPGVQLPSTRRHLVRQIQRRLETRLAPIVVVRGPRQIGKTTAQLQVLQDLLDAGVPPRQILRVQCDEIPAMMGQSEPILRVVEWFERVILGKTLNEAARDGEKTFLFFDEVQNLRSWAEQLKHLVDTSTTQVVVTGSSALRIEQGRDSLAGRITGIESGVLSLTEISLFHGTPLGDPFLQDNGLGVLTEDSFWRDLASHGRTVSSARNAVFKEFSDRGGYPLVHTHQNVEWAALADQLNETVIKRVIQHDLRVGERGRKRDAQLLEEVFRLACRYVGQSPAAATLAREARRSLNANIGDQRATHYLRFLGDTLLLRLIDPLEIRLKRKGGNAKICLADHGLRASWLQEMIPLDADGLEANPHLSDLAGRIAESVAGAVLSTVNGLDIAHLPERGKDPEVDFVLTVGTRRIPLEVKYQRTIDPQRDTRGLRAFMEKEANNAPFGVLVCREDYTLSDPDIVALPLSTLMLLR